MKRNGAFWTLTLLVIAGVGYLIADFLIPKKTASATQQSAKADISTTRESAPVRKRSSKNLSLNKKNNVKPEVEEDVSNKVTSDKENIEAQFQALRDEQRRQWQEIFGEDRDKMRAIMRSAIDSHPEFSEMFRRSREIRDNWPTSSDSEKPQLLAELTELRQKGLEIIKVELEKYNRTPPAIISPESTPNISPTPSNPAENDAPAESDTPKEPSVIM